MPSLSLRSLRDVLLLIAAPRRSIAPLLAAAALYEPGCRADDAAEGPASERSS